MNKKKIYMIIAVAVVLALVVEFLFAHPHVYFWWHALPGFDIGFGLLGAILLIFVAKGIVGPLLQRKEDYYDGGEDDE